MANALIVNSSIQQRRDRRVRIRILNAHPGCKETTGIDQAARYVASGAAEWFKVGVSIRFFDTNAIHQKICYDTAARTGHATRAELRALPIIGDLRKLITVRRRA